MLIGYARVSTREQDTASQRAAMAAAGVVRIVEEKRSGWAERPALRALLVDLQPGDVLCVYKVDRLARSLIDLIAILGDVADAGAEFRSLTEPIETTTSVGRLMVHVLGAFAQFEREVIRERCEAGRQAARERGVKFGRKTKLRDQEVRELSASGKTLTEASAAAGVSTTTMRRAGNRLGLEFVPGARGKGAPAYRAGGRA